MESIIDGRKHNGRKHEEVEAEEHECKEEVAEEVGYIILVRLCVIDTGIVNPINSFHEDYP